MKSALNEELIPYLNSGPETDAQKNKVPDIFIAFDEAHSLMGLKGDGSNHFLKLCWALRMMERDPCFTFFLSTTGKISKLVPPMDVDLSIRTDTKGLIPSLPFSDLGFDHLMRDHKIFDKFKTIDDVTSESVDCVVRMGRPL